MVVLVSCNNGDQIKSEGDRMVNIFSIVNQLEPSVTMETNLKVFFYPIYLIMYGSLFPTQMKIGQLEAKNVNGRTTDQHSTISSHSEA